LGNNNLINGGGASRTIAALGEVAASTNFFVHNGDISYADDYGLLLPFEFYEQAWNNFQNALSGITAKNIYMTGPGNHEVTCFQLGDSFCQNSFARKIFLLILIVFVCLVMKVVVTRIYGIVSIMD